MKQQITLILFLPVFSGIMLIASCNTDDEEPAFEVDADACIVLKKIDGEPKSAIAFYVFANSGIASATVEPPGRNSKPLPLQKSDESAFSFYRFPGDEEFRAQFPVTGTYNFEVVSKRGKSVQQQDSVSIVFMSVPEIISITPDKGKSSLTINWTPVEGMNGYVVKLYHPGGGTIYSGKQLTSAASKYTITPGEGKWITTLKKGDRAILQLHALRYQTGNTTKNRMNNLNGIAIAEASIIWEQ